MAVYMGFLVLSIIVVVFWWRRVGEKGREGSRPRNIRQTELEDVVLNKIEYKKG